MKTIKVKSSGLVTTVSDEYFEQYENGGWFIEVPPEKLIVKNSVKPKVEPKVKPPQE
jgi:hypothetical protein